MAPDPIQKIVADYYAGRVTAHEVLHVATMNAAEGDASAIFAQLPVDLQTLFVNDYAGFSGNRAEFFVLASHCGPDDPEYAPKKQRLEDIAFRGTMALLRVVRGTPGGG